MSGTWVTILAAQISAPCSPCMNWLICQPWKWRRTLAFSCLDMDSYWAMPLLGIVLVQLLGPVDAGLGVPLHLHPLAVETHHGGAAVVIVPVEGDVEIL